ncbi:hypothetical protein [Tepidibacter formicigenes]|jgi:hypothetical protein|uniref:Uncharacterized protein n=1 Tax=Tepidibacter formicigenes DSM 15518 TaxID=1123349 RepID=A0A1M6SM89_9FIRM|nr:hypothetical protein [Tepidibacter formicigenes]SHK45825.1 hypothetical protein SAMN02744037_02376 [Tepidibacter formicigenes DSM 15518]
MKEIIQNNDGQHTSRPSTEWMEQIVEIKEETSMDRVRNFLAKGNWVVIDIYYSEPSKATFVLGCIKS